MLFLVYINFDAVSHYCDSLDASGLPDGENGLGMIMNLRRRLPRMVGEKNWEVQVRSDWRGIYETSRVQRRCTNGIYEGF